MKKTSEGAVQQYWADLMIEELIRLGVDYFCISPGSRSAPLTLAVSGNKSAKSFVHFDERAVAYHAMGYAAAKKGGAAIITTSGTAVANLLPAVVEASKKKLPLVILTADRPVELRHTGANQTIEQVNIFGSYVRWNFDITVPAEQIKPTFILSTVDQAVHRSKGEWPGPVHLNCMFREPLYTESKESVPKAYKQLLNSWSRSGKPFTEYVRASGQLSKDQIWKMTDLINLSVAGLIVTGKLPDESSRDQIVKLAEKLNWPIFPDITSGLRLGQRSNHIIFNYDQIVDHLQFNFDTVLHFGGRITSKRFYTLLEKTQPKTYLMVLNHPLRNDPQHGVTHRVQCHAGDFCRAVLPGLKKKADPSILPKLKKLDQSVSVYLDKHLTQSETITEPGICRSVTRLIPPNHILYAASSLPIRELDMFADHTGGSVSVGANRGASGIDGTIASAAGYSAGTNKRATLIAGDLSFLYDLNALSMLKDLINPMVIVLLNNDGGGIFEFFPVSKSGAVYKKYFETPHGLTFQKAAELFDLEYNRPNSMTEFESAYLKGVKSQKSVIIEILTEKQENFNFQQQLRRHIKALIRGDV
ncbi:MAG: 2-succinyl-5-enolpyruvyl-6-hydroxy-3-cyclohexene-1-carboxylic-acid synthase [Candidatus Omnitrophota bacterium]